MTDYTQREFEDAYMLYSLDSNVEDLMCAKYVQIAEDSEEAAGRRRENRLSLGSLSPEECRELFRFDQADSHLNWTYRLILFYLFIIICGFPKQGA